MKTKDLLVLVFMFCALNFWYEHQNLKPKQCSKKNHTVPRPSNQKIIIANLC